MFTNTRVSEEQKHAAEKLLGKSDHLTSFYYDIDWTEQRVCVDGHFTVEELEAIILLKRYKDQQKGS